MLEIVEKNLERRKIIIERIDSKNQEPLVKNLYLFLMLSML